MKCCKYCGVLQPEEHFPICSVINGKQYRRHKCQDCIRLYKADRRGEVQRWLETYKQTLVCERCGFDDFRALQFHHKQGQEKLFNVADMPRSRWSRETILIEIQKCLVLCANCHQIDHYEEHRASRFKYCERAKNQGDTIPLENEVNNDVIMCEDRT